MEFVKKFGFWIVFALVVIGAILFYVLAVRSQAVARKRQLQDLKTRRETLQGYASKPELPNMEFVEREQELQKVVDAEIAKCKQIVAHQRRNNHTQIFWVPGDPMKREVTKPVYWLDRYREEKELLQRQIVNSGLGTENLVSFPDYWGAVLPTWGEIRNAQVHFWLRKDIIDLLTNHAEQDILDELKFRGDKKMQTLLDVVRNPSAIEQELSKNLAQTKTKKDLEGILQDILVNAEQLDLAEIFQRHNIREFVEQITMDDRQRKFLRHLRSSAKDRPDLAEYIMDLRMVRYRDDLIGLFKNHGFSQLSRRLRDWGADSEAMLAEELASPTWRPLDLARAIEAAVSIAEERDLNVILRNHRIRLLAVNGLRFEDVIVFSMEDKQAGAPGVTPPRRTMPGGGPMDEPPMDEPPMDEPPMEAAPGRSYRGGRGRTTAGQAPGRPGVYNAFPFDLNLTMEFRHLPVLYRRLLMSDWRIEIKGVSVTKAEGAGRPTQRRDRGGPGPEEPEGMPPGPEGPPPGPAIPNLGAAAGVPAAQPEVPGQMPGPPGMPPEEQDEKKVRVAPRNYVKVQLECEARQFYPLWKSLYPDRAKEIEQKFAE